MSNTGPVIRVFSIGEDWVFSFRFVDKNGASVAMNGSGVGYKIRFVDKKTHAVKTEVLDTAASGALALAIGGTGNNEIMGRLAKATASAWGKARFSADLIRYTSSTEKRIIPVIVSQVEDGDTDVQNSAGVIGAIIDATTFDLNGPAYIIYDGPKGDAWGSAPVAWSTGLVCVSDGAATVVTYNGSTYRCNTAHTAGATFAADAAKWTALAMGGNTILSVTGAPSNGAGNNGDLAFDPVTTVLTGPKSGGAWPYGRALISTRPRSARSNVGIMKGFENYSALGTNQWQVLSNCTLALDTTNYKLGSAALAITTTSALAGKARKTLASPVSHAGADWLELNIYVAPAQLAGLTGIDFVLIDAAGASRSYQIQSATFNKSGWSSTLIPLSQQNYTGGVIDWATINRYQVDVSPVSATPVTVVVDAHYLYASKNGGGRFMVVTDGGNTPGVPQIADYLLARGCRMAIASNGYYTAQAAHMTPAELRAAQDQGHFILLYTGSIMGGATSWANASDAQKLSSVQTGQAWMRSEGFYKGARFLSTWGTGGWDAFSDGLLGTYLDWGSAGKHGSVAWYATPSGPYGAYSWLNGYSTDPYRSGVTLAQTAAAVAACDGCLIFFGHFDGVGNDTVANGKSAIDTMLAAGLRCITPDEFALA